MVTHLHFFFCFTRHTCLKTIHTNLSFCDRKHARILRRRCWCEWDWFIPDRRSLCLDLLLQRHVGNLYVRSRVTLQQSSYRTLHVPSWHGECREHLSSFQNRNAQTLRNFAQKMHCRQCSRSITNFGHFVHFQYYDDNYDQSKWGFLKFDYSQHCLIWTENTQTFCSNVQDIKFLNLK